MKEEIIKITESEIIEAFKSVDKNRKRGESIKPIQGVWRAGKRGKVVFEFEIIQIEKDDERILIGIRTKEEKGEPMRIGVLEFSEKEGKKLREELEITEKEEWIETIYRKGREKEEHIWF